MKTLVLGLGNPLLRDDNVGLRVAEEVAVRVLDQPGVEVEQDYWGGLRLMERMIGYERAIVIDAICSGGRPGMVYVLSPDDIPTQRSASSHDVNLSTALQFGRLAGARLPKEEDIVLVAIEAGDVHTFDQSLTPAVESAIPQAVETVLKALDLEGEMT
jgi:hydrogenase maturation protease